MARTFGFGSVDHADRALEPRLDQGLSQMVVVQIEPEGGQPGLMEERFVAPVQGGPNALALGYSVPVGRGGDRAAVGGEANQPGAPAVALAHQLPHVQLTAVSHFGAPRITEV